MSSPDSLSVTSRSFYERAKNKVAGSIFLFGAALMLLGFCAVAGGLSNANQIWLGECCAYRVVQCILLYTELYACFDR